jgi:hypothetical protein
VRPSAAIAIVLAIAFVAWLLLRGGDDDAPSATRAPAPAATPRAASTGELRALATREGPIYWAGPDRGGTLELSRPRTGATFVRHLPPGTEAGTRTGVLTVATYELRDAIGAVRRAGRAPGARTFRLPGGGLGVTNRRQPTNAYFAVRGTPVQVEVFDPRPGRAAELVRSGRIVPVPAAE